MGGLNYRETLDKRYKKYKGELRIFDGYEALNNKVTLKFNEKELTVEYINNSIVKVFLGERNEEEILTNAVILDSSKREIIKVEETNDKIIIKGEKLVTEVNKLSTEITFLDVNNNIICEDFQPSFKDEEGNIYISKVNDSLAYYGLGEKGGELNKKGTYTENYNTDDPETTDDSVMYYKTIPFYVGLKENNCHGIYFDNSFRSYYDMGKEYGDRIYFGAVGGQIRYYFILGDDIKDVVKEYTSLTGKMDMPPLWSLGYQQNRFSYFSKEEVYDLVNTFKENEIPLDVIYLDIDYMDGFRVMTFKTPNFENAKKLIKDLKDMGIKTVTILDPGVKVDENYDIYKSGKLLNHFTKKSDGETFVGAVWPGDSVFPDFSNEKCRTWWKENLKKFISENDIAGIWNDMNEPCVFNNDHKTMLESCIHNSDFGVIEHKEFHNRYGFEMSRCSFEAQRELDNNKRGFSMTRATFSGGQRYSSVWTGDNMSLWSQMRMSIVMNSNLGISGFSFASNDVGGFGLDCEEELFIRWMEIGAFLPIFRNHSNMYTRRQEPWAFGKRALDISKKFINLRYELMPYIYNLFFESHKDGLPVFRPLVMEYKDDINVYNLKEEFMLGDSILVSPVLVKGERSKVVYLPKGNWYNYFTNEKFEGSKRYKFKCDLDETLVFVREGSIIPVFLEKYTTTEKRPSKVTFKVYGENSKGYYYFDDGETLDYKKGKYNLSKINVKGEEINIEYLNKGLEETEKEFIFIK
ncbi:MAG: glycoside hydrolase family 31 protein [Clostridium chrysemydis]|uniref:glycoside hydrolase family 31 protein n=1 Tax=Clostridium chrysemydis TaxID=2665504 RepID=UPI003F2B1CD9